ncbi:DUF4238 domain-containing protein [Thioclava indica]|uniref:DUF4238 domain-containing protein n=1 Tax=Thioclava indica TaxID=1353528 RepID=UPI0009DF325B
MTNKSKRHHYVPQSLLNGFCFQGSTLLLFDRAEPEKGIRERNVKKAFQAFYENSFIDLEGKRNSSAEIEFARRYDNDIRNVAARFFSRVQTDDDVRFLAKFCASWLLRTPSLRDRIFSESGVSDVLHELQQLVLEDPRLAHRRKKMAQEIGAENWGEKLRAEFGIIVPEEIVDTLLSGTYALVKPSVGSSEFIMTDTPVANFGGTGAENSEVWSILAPKLAVVFFPERKNPAPFISVPADAAVISMVNRHFAERARYIAARCPLVIHEAVKGLPVHREN